MKKAFLIFTTFLLVFTCDDIIEVPDISNETVTTLAPSNASVLTNTEVVFTWNSVLDAEQYKLQIATPTFDAATQIVLDSTITTTSFTKTLIAGDYEWRIRAENSGYETAYTTQSFSVE